LLLLSRQGWAIQYYRSKELSGRDIDVHVPDRMPHPVSDDAYEDLLTSIDHQVAGTQDKIERACLIRDKVMLPLDGN